MKRNMLGTVLTNVVLLGTVLWCVYASLTLSAKLNDRKDAENNEITQCVLKTALPVIECRINRGQMTPTEWDNFIK